MGETYRSATDAHQSPNPKVTNIRDFDFPMRRDFGFDPLLDHKGVEMKWTGRIAPQQSPTVVRTQK
jgi:hypothetical protein